MSSGNDTRDEMLRRAIKETVALQEPLVMGNVMEKLPGDFFAKMDSEADEELSEALREMGLTDAPMLRNIEPEPVSRDTEAELTAPGRQVEPEPVKRFTEAEPEPMSRDIEAEPGAEVKISFEQSQHLLQLAQVKLDNARLAAQVADQAVKEARTVAARCIEAWQRQDVIYSLSPAERQQFEIRNHLAGEAKRRAENPRRGITRGAEMVRARMNTGNARGAFSRQQAARLGFTMPGSAAAAARLGPKVPS